MEEKIKSRIDFYRAKQRKESKSNIEENVESEKSEEVSETEEAETRFNSALSTLLAENCWELTTTRSGRYKVQFKPTLDYNDRINILEIVLEDIRERYCDIKANFQHSKRKFRKRMKARDSGECSVGAANGGTHRKRMKGN